MGCSSCQQNNHVVPTTHVHNSTTQSHCECACGCDEPVCPTPQPCTEITDSKCIIYTDPAILCGNETVVASGSPVSTALNQMVAFFCAQQGLTIPIDLVCDGIVIVPGGTSLQIAIQLLSVFICEVASIPGPVGPPGAVGPQGPTPWTLPATVYNNGAAYPLGAAVTFQGGYYYRTGNALNPGYPPIPGSISPSWTPVADGGNAGLYGPNYIYVPADQTETQNGQNLFNAYTAALGLTPNGNPLSENNRYTILLAPGIYKLPFILQWDTNFIDLACIGGVATLQPHVLYGVPLIVNLAKDTQFSNIKLIFPFLDDERFTGWPVVNNLPKVLLHNCSGYADFPGRPIDNFTINRDYLTTKVTRNIQQSCINPSGLIYLGFNYADVGPTSVNKTIFAVNQTTDLFMESHFDLGSITQSIIEYFAGSQYSSYASITTTLPLTDKYIIMNISNLVGTFSLNDVVTQGGTTGVITETDNTTYFVAYVATGVFPNGTGTITNITSGGTADNNGWFQAGNSMMSNSFNGLTASALTGFFTVNATAIGNTTPTSARARGIIDFPSQMYIQYEGPNTSFDSSGGASIATNNLGGTATLGYSTNAGEIIISNLVGTWLGATTIWNDLNTTPVTITGSSQNIIHTLTKTVTNK